MSKIDKIKERISLLKFWLGICVALIISLASWLLNNYQNINFLFWCGILFLFVLFFIVLKISIVINKLINKLEEL